MSAPAVYKAITAIAAPSTRARLSCPGLVSVPRSYVVRHATADVGFQLPELFHEFPGLGHELHDGLLGRRAGHP